MSTIAADAKTRIACVVRAQTSVRRRRYLSTAGTAVLSFMIIV
jgi:hypothetical protein